MPMGLLQVGILHATPIYEHAVGLQTRLLDHLSAVVRLAEDSRSASAWLLKACMRAHLLWQLLWVRVMGKL